MSIETTFASARENLPELCSRAADDREVVIIRRDAGGDVALVAAEEVSSLMETAHLLRSPANAERLLRALARARGWRGELGPKPIAAL